MTAGTRYRIGWMLGALAYLFPLAVGTLWFVRLVPPMLLDVAPYRPIVHVGLANLMFTGFSGIIVCCHGLRLRIRAFWFVHLVFVVWVVTNDLYAAVRGGWVPMPLVPGTLGTLSLLLTLDCLRTPREPESEPGGSDPARDGR